MKKEPAAPKTGSQLPVATLAKTIKVLITKGDQNLEKAQQFYKAAGIHLKELKARKPRGTPWPQYVKVKFNIGQERADELIRIGDGRITLAQVQAKHAEKMRKLRAKHRAESGARAPDSAAPDQEIRADIKTQIRELQGVLKEPRISTGGPAPVLLQTRPCDPRIDRRARFSNILHEAETLAGMESDLSALFDFDALAEAATRVANLWEAVAKELRRLSNETATPHKRVA